MGLWIYIGTVTLCHLIKAVVEKWVLNDPKSALNTIRTGALINAFLFGASMYVCLFLIGRQSV